jgi:hypothetical protein
MQLQPIVERATLTPAGRIQLMDEHSVSRVAELVRSRGKQVVWVEGFSGAGKSNFAHRLAHELGWGYAIELDGQLLEEQPDVPSYVDKIDMERLRRTIGAARRHGGFVVEGVCLRAVVHALVDRTEAFVVYMARVSAPSQDSLLWHDGFGIESTATDEPWLWARINDYHRSHAPHVDADQILLRIGD